MIKYCIDTNAILDLCYRYYPPSIFKNVWDDLEASILSRHICFLISEHIYEEVKDKIILMKYDESIFTQFMEEFNVSKIYKKDYKIDLIQIQAELLNITQLNSSISRNEDDLSNICVAKNENATVITAEQGSQLKITDPNYKRLKIPDTCEHYSVKCQNWISLFQYIGL
ncbi:DUF4411 family protein [Psychrobacter sp. FDAARGOS_221]|uniref:DUF4411 family protein n=1 Tax=Psychrobacter sp. FDAARGOS_221 TaxID=1975705 RepID=UPI000BB567D2|nr:DUF4411 family protein [Psychrobacter sp. FDAARGOS_221]PNK59508.1 DUF4411 domain-containing protein [Psychrobacter sp. FDAARGOS_221]